MKFYVEIDIAMVTLCKTFEIRSLIYIIDISYNSYKICLIILKYNVSRHNLFHVQMLVSF